VPYKATVRRWSLLFLFAALLSVGGAGRANAQGFISPFIGYNFGGKAGCQQITNCEDKHANYGVAVGAVGNVIGLEGEFAYTNDFFGQSSTQTSSVWTLMGNFMVAPRFGKVQPYGLVGLGLIRSSVGNSSSSNDQNQFGYDVGGGLMVFFNQHVGVRGDVRYYHSFNVFDTSHFPNLPAVNLGGQKLDYGRAAIGVVFRF
jgi:opacity protein-like surface antigen